MLVPIGDENPQKSVPLITWLILAANVVVFIYGAALPRDQYRALVERYAFFPSDPSKIAYISSSFLHAGFFHIFFNMLFLWIFADNVEDQFGHFGFLVFYLVGAVVSVAGFRALSGPIHVPLIGASGAIAAVLGAYLVMFPSNRIKILFWILIVGVFHVRAAIAILVWFVIQVVWTYAEHGTGSTGGVAYGAHASGFLFGFIVTLLLRLTGLVRPPKRHAYSY